MVAIFFTFVTGHKHEKSQQHYQPIETSPNEKLSPKNAAQLLIFFPYILQYAPDVSVGAKKLKMTTENNRFAI